MLPTVETFEGFFAQLPGPENRADFVRDFHRDLTKLTERAGRARALAALELFEWLASEDQRRHRGMDRYSRVAKRLGVTKARASQLVADGREWRQTEQSNG